MKIGVDLDGVINNTQKKFTEFYNLKTGKHIDFEKIKRFHYWDDESISETKDEIIELFNEFHDGEDDFHLVEGAESALSFLSGVSEIFIITARPSKFKEKTEKLLKMNLKEIDLEVIFSAELFGGEKKKPDICIEKEIDFLIEDSKENAKECAEKGIKVFLLNYPWNQDFEHEKVIRVKNWEHVLEIIKSRGVENENWN